MKKKAFTLIEILLGLSIIAVITVGVFVLYNKVHNKSMAMEEIATIRQMSNDVKFIFNTGDDYEVLDTDYALENNIFPQRMLSKTEGPLNVFKGNVEIESAKITPSKKRNSGFRITYKNVPNEQCVQMVNALKDDFYAIYVYQKKTVSKDISYSLANVNKMCYKEGKVTGISFYTF